MVVSSKQRVGVAGGLLVGVVVVCGLLMSNKEWISSTKEEADMQVKTTVAGEHSWEKRVNGKIYFVNKDKNRLTHDQAKAKCEAQGYALARIETTGNADALGPLVESSAWFGVKREMGSKDRNGWLYEATGVRVPNSQWIWNGGEGVNEHQPCTRLHATINRAHDYECTATTKEYICEDLSNLDEVDMLFKDEFIVVKGHGYGYNAANDFCKMLGTHLAVISSNGQNNKVKDGMKELGVQDAWFGKKKIAGKWVNEDGTTTSFKNWRSGQEGQGGGAKVDGTFDKYDWTSEEFYMTNVDGWICAGFSWSLVVLNEGVSIEFARSYCLANFGTTARVSTVRSAEENADMHHAVKEVGHHAWIGLNDLNNEKEWRWEDGSPVSFTNWGGKEPNNAGGNEDCTQFLTNGLWNDAPCTHTQPAFFCEANPGDETEIRMEGYHVVKTSIKFAQGDGYCQAKYGTKMASIHSAVDNAKLVKALKALKLSKGLIGLDELTAQKFKWTDGSKFDYSNWMTGALNTKTNAVLRASDGKWEPVKGSDSHAAVICAAKDHYVNLCPANGKPPFGDRLLSHFNGGSFTPATTVWSDLSGHHHNSAPQGDQKVVVRDESFPDGKKHKILVGHATTRSKVVWSTTSDVMNAESTFFHVTAYGTAGAMNRIWTSTTGNWLDGHWATRSGVAHHNRWLANANNEFGRDWAIYASSAKHFQAYSKNKYVVKNDNSATWSAGLCIGCWSGEYSPNWRAAEALVYEGLLNDNDRKIVVGWLNNKYHLVNPTLAPYCG